MMDMELTDLIQAHNSASHQVTVLECRLADLQTRHMAINPDTQEVNYLQTKKDITKAMMRMYQQYRDDKWNQLQRESAIFLQSILQAGNRVSNYDDAPMTPPESPPQHETMSLWTPEIDGEPIHVHQLPAPLTPIRDDDDHLMLTPPSSPRYDRHTSRMHYYSRNLSSLFDGESRDV